MRNLDMFKKDPGRPEATASLSSIRRFALIAAVVGAVFPVLFLAVIRPVYWLGAFQLACLSVLAYIRWREPRFRGSLVVFILVAIACAVSLVAGFAA